MFTRIVKMEFKSEEVVNFLSKFDMVKEKIRAFDGCAFLELYQDFFKQKTAYEME